jgi:hypothetical protein
MLATLEKIETNTAPLIVPKTEGANHGAFEMNIDAEAQNALDSILNYYHENALKPVVKTQGSPLDITVALTREVKQSLPDAMQVQAKVLLDFTVREIVAYARENSARNLSLNFAFERT